MGTTVLLIGLSSTRVALADPLPSNDYQIDLFTGPLLLPIRVVSLGGAYSGLGEDIPGLVSNAAAPAVREASSFRHVEVDIHGSFSIPLDAFENNDFDDSGDVDADYSNFIYATGGVNLQIGPFGVGALADAQTYRLSDEQGRETAVVVGRQVGLVAANFVKGQLAVGAGTRSVTVGFDPVGEDFFYAGVAPQFGVLVRPNGVPFRFGTTFRLPVVAKPLFPFTSEDEGPARTGKLVFPRAIVEPWQLEVGIAVQVGKRPLNVPFIDPEDEDDAAEERIESARRGREIDRERLIHAEMDPARQARLRAELDERERDQRVHEDAWMKREVDRILGRFDDAFADLPRERLLLLLSLVASGPVDKGVSLERFLAQNEPGSSADVIGSSGSEVNFSPRFGVEVEPIENWLILRAGSYYEPNRFGRVGRQHFTFGSQLKLFHTDLFGLTPELAYGVEAGMDIAPRYQSLSASITVFR